MNIRKPLFGAVYIVYGIIAVISLFPICYIVLASFRTNHEIFTYALPFTWKTLIPQHWTFLNYIEIFHKMHFGLAIRNTIIVVLVTVPISLFISALGGFSFAFFDFRGKKFIFALCLVSFMIPTDAIAIPLYNEISNLKLVNTFWALILPGCANGLAIFLFTQFFKDMPKSLLEAARIDGADWIQIFFQIVLPLSAPVVITAGLMIFVSQWNDFLWPLLVTRSEAVRTIQVALAYFEDENEVFFSYIYAGATISALVPMLAFLPLQKYFVQGITSSGIKG